MRRILLSLVVVFLTNCEFIIANTGKTETTNDSVRLVELDQYWAEVSRAVNEGDFIGFKSTFHDDAVIVYTTDGEQLSMSVEKAFANWEQGFVDTKEGKQQSSVEFRFSRRIGDETSAHERGIFHYKATNSNGNVSSRWIHFDMLLIKLDNSWLLLMEYQKSIATPEEWEELKSLMSSNPGN